MTHAGRVDVLRILVVDDEPLARRRLTRMLGSEPGVEVAGQCSGGAAAIERLRERPVDLLLLDVQMPEVDGFAVLRALSPTQRPDVVFVTAHDEHALRAFEVNAVDYLLKPFDQPRLRTALARVRARREGSGAKARDAGLQALLDSVGGAEPPLERLLVKTSSGRSKFVRLIDVDWIEAAGNYVHLHIGARVHAVRSTLRALEARLDPRQFGRIHRSQIVNLDRVDELQPWSHGDVRIVLKDGTELTLSRTQRPAFEGRWGSL